jgi:hypothetical protein
LFSFLFIFSGLKGACGELGAKGQPGRDAVCQPQLQIKGEKGDRGANGPPGRDGPMGLDDLTILLIQN